MIVEQQVRFLQCRGIGRVQILCMGCHDKPMADIYLEPECLNSRVYTPKSARIDGSAYTKSYCAEEPPDLPSHDAVRVGINAKDVLKGARWMLLELKLKKKLTPKCIHCQKVVLLPRWYCVDCTSGVSICQDYRHIAATVIPDLLNKFYTIFYPKLCL